MKVGDLVMLSTRATRKGMRYEDEVGLVIGVHATQNTSIVIITANFSGEICELPLKDLMVIK